MKYINKIQTICFPPWWFVLLFFLYSNAISAQSTTIIEGTLKNESDEAVSNASVLLKNSAGEIVSYAISEQDGSFDLAIPSTETYLLEVSHISFSLYSEIIKFDRDTISKPFNIELKPKSNTLDEVVIQGRRSVIQQQGDTLSYVLDAFTTGNEQKLKDIIEKLPGLEIDMNGRIKSEGKVIGSLLVDGKPFFGDNHKVATDNLNAEMIEGIEVLKNYETFNAVKEIEGSNETALNILIKEKYKGKPTGNIEAYGAYNDRYRLHTNLFSFAETNNFSFIGDINNTGQEPISLLDFIQMDKSRDIKNKEDQISSIGTGIDPPRFLLNSDNKTKQLSQFGAINAVVAPGENVAIDAFSILDIEGIKSKQFSERYYFSQAKTIYSDEWIEEKNDFLINQTNINAQYKPNDNSLLDYSLNYKPIDSKYYTNIDGEVENDEQTTLQKVSNNGYSLGQNLGYTIQLAKNKLVAVNAYSNYIQDNTQLNLSSNRSLFNMGNTIAQETHNREQEYGVYSRYTQRIKNHIIKFNLGYTWNKSKFYNASLPDEAISLSDQNYFYTGVSAEHKKGFFQYKALINIRKYNNSFSDKNEDSWLFLPAIESKFQFSKTHYFSFKYSRQVALSKANQLNLFNYVKDYRNFRLGSEVDYNRILTNNHFNFQYFYLNLYSGTQILLNSFYNRTDNNIGVNTEIIERYNYSYSLNTSYKSSWINRFRVQTRISPIKMIFKLGIDYTNTVFNNYIDTDKNKAINNQFSIQPLLSSYFKDAWLNYEVGIDIKQNNTRFDLTDLENTGSETSPFINLNGEISQHWSYYLNNKLAHYKASNFNRNFYQVDFELRHQNTESKFSYWVSGENILNIKNSQILEAVATQNSISRNVIHSMPGYIGMGVSYDF